MHISFWTFEAEKNLTLGELNGKQYKSRAWLLYFHENLYTLLLLPNDGIISL